MLVVLVSDYHAVLGNRTVSSVTYNGTNLTHAAADGDGSTGERTEIWYLLNPSTGSNNIVVTTGGPVTSLNAFGFSMTGVQQSGQPDAARGVFVTPSETPIADSITTSADNSWVVSVVQGVEQQTTGVSGMTEIGSLDTGWNRAAYSGPHTPAGSVTHTYTVVATTRGPFSLMSVKPATATTTIPSSLCLMGVG